MDNYNCTFEKLRGPIAFNRGPQWEHLLKLLEAVAARCLVPTEKAALKPQKGSETFHGSGHLCKGKGKRQSRGKILFYSTGL